MKKFVFTTVVCLLLGTMLLPELNRHNEYHVPEENISMCIFDYEEESY